MIPHFMIVMSATNGHERRAELFLNMLEKIGKVSDYHCTLILQKHERISNKRLRLMADVHLYEPDGRYFFPWSTSPRWRVPPKSDLVVCCDNDLLVLRDLNPFLREAHDSHAINALVCLLSPWEASACNLHPDTSLLTEPGDEPGRYLDMWRRLFEKCGVAFPEKLHYHTLFNGNPFHDPQAVLTPYFPNHGFMAMNSGVFQTIADAYYPLLRKCNDLIHKNYFIVQVAAALAIQKCGVKAIDMPLEYNFVNCPDLREPTDVAVYHYAYTRDSVRNHLKDKGLHRQFIYDGMMS